MGAARITRMLITGASGFVGGAILARFRREAALLPIAGIRDAARLPRGTESRRIDLTDPATLPEALEGIDTLVHCAAGGRAVTDAGSAALFRAAATAGVRRLVHLSSISVYGAASGEVREDHALIPPGGRGYAAWKRAAEDHAASAAATGMQVAMLRPAIIYGAGSELWVGRMACRIASGAWGRFGTAGEGLCNLVHVADVAEAALAAATAPAMSGAEAFNVSGPAPVTWNAWFSLLAQAMRRPPLPEISPAALRFRTLAGLVPRALARAVPPLRPALAPRITASVGAGEAAIFGLRAHYPADRAARRLGWTPRIGLEEGLADCTAWLREQGLA